MRGVNESWTNRARPRLPAFVFYVCEVFTLIVCMQSLQEEGRELEFFVTLRGKWTVLYENYFIRKHVLFQAVLSLTQVLPQPNQQPKTT